LSVGCSRSPIIPSKSIPFASASRSLTFRKRIDRPSAKRAMRRLISSITGIAAMSSLRGKIAVRTIVACGALLRITSRIARMPRLTSPARSAALTVLGALPTLFVPASSTITLGFTPSSSPFWSRHRMFCVASAPQPKLAAFQPKNRCVQWARKSG
jgi:hypothetical protein